MAPSERRGLRAPRLTTPTWTVLAAGSLVAVVATAGLLLHPWRHGVSASSYQHPASVRSLHLPGTAREPGAAPSPPAGRLPPDTDRSARAAVAGYLSARRDGDVKTSYLLLSTASRRTYPSQASWLDAVADLPAPASFTVVGARAKAGAVDVAVDVRRTAVLDGFVGFVPAHALETYRTSRDAAGWRVDAEPVRTTPHLISDGTASAAVGAWLGRLAACDTAGAAAGQVAADLLGDGSVAATVCAAHLVLRAEPAIPLTGGPDTAPFLAAYGPETSTWARLVPVTGAGRTFLVGVAPMGHTWRVFGIVPSPGD